MLKIGRAIFFWNFAAFLVGVALIGGDAVSGHAEGGRYFIAYRGAITEVSRGVYLYSMIHALSVFATAALALGCSYLLSKQNAA